MAMGSLGPAGGRRPMHEINVIPLVDVMLVLLVIFMVTAPLLTHSVRLELPRAASSPTTTIEEPLRLEIDAEGNVAWNGERVDDEGLRARMAEAGQRTPQAELLIRADRRTSYEVLARVMSQAARNGLPRIGFITDPHEAPD